jgi:ABC-type transport system involved in Fe-S cluster assembly fused permease/ATPase subunit
MTDRHHIGNTPGFENDEAMKVIENVFAVIALLFNFLTFVMFIVLVSVFDIILYGPRWRFFVVSCLLIFPLYFVLVQFLTPDASLTVAFSPRAVLLNLLSATVVTHFHNPDEKTYQNERGELNDFTRNYICQAKDALSVLFSRF